MDVFFVHYGLEDLGFEVQLATREVAVAAATIISPMDSKVMVRKLAAA